MRDDTVVTDAAPISMHFATVRLSDEQNAPLATLRVPVVLASTTVRQLAKDTMSRFMRTRWHHITKQDARLGGVREKMRALRVGITDVWAGGATSPYAEVFAEDVVTHIIDLKDDIVFMRLRSGGLFNAIAQQQQQQPPPQLPPPLHVPLPIARSSISSPANFATVERKSELIASLSTSSPNLLTTATAEEEEGQDHADVCVTQPIKRSAITSWPSQDRRRPRSEPDDAPISDPSDGDSNASDSETEGDSDDSSVHILENEEVIRSAAELRESRRQRLGWGPEAYKNFAPNYVSSPQKLMKRRKAAAANNEQQKAAVAPKSNKPTANSAAAAAAVSSPSAAKKEPSTAAKKLLSAQATTPPTTKARTAGIKATPSPVVSKALHTPLNSKQKGKPTAAAAAAGSGATVVRQLEFDSGLGDGSCTPVMRPKGWGPDALKGFDPATYCDNPDRAMLSEEELAKPIRAHRNVELPWYFGRL